MRLYFPNLIRPKKVAKSLSEKFGLPLSLTQTTVARICGFSDWHDLEQNHSKNPFCVLDQKLEDLEFIERQAQLALTLAQELAIPDSDAQHALADCRLTGDRPVLLADQIDIRLCCWRKSSLPVAGRRERGSTGNINAAGWEHEAAILRSFGKPTTVITDKNVTTTSDFEYVSPRNPPPLFLPIRLYLPYGYWVEKDGAKVIFSRDYKPMWRIRDGVAPERLNPWDSIAWRDQFFLWDESDTPCRNSSDQYRLERFLVSFGIQTLPILADALPLLILNDKIRSFADAVEPLKMLRGGAINTAA